MALISKVGRRSLPVRILITSLYVILSVGAVTMVYPFLLMVSGSFKSNVDQDDFDIFPAFVYDTTVLYRKHLECKYNNAISEYGMTNRIKAYEFRTIAPPERVVPRRVDDWKAFESARAPGPGTYHLGYMTHRGDRLRLWGGFGTQHLLPRGTPEEIRAEVRRLCREMGRGGGYILAPAKPLQPETPTENAVAAIEAFTNQEG